MTRPTCAAAVLAVALLGCDGRTTSPEAVPRGFVDVTDEWGIAADHGLVLGGSFALPEITGSGCALVDVDGDGRLEIYVVRAGRSPDRGAVDQLLARGADGGWSTRPTPASGYGMGVAVGDYDGDGDDDVFVSQWGPDVLLRNDGGTLVDVTAEAGVGDGAWSSSAAFADLDLDGDLDLYVCRYVDVDPERVCTDASGRREYCGPAAFPPLHDRIWRNEGDGTFVDVSSAWGVAGAPQPSLGLGVADFDGDGRLDVFVANDGAPNQLWCRDGELMFRDRAPQLGVAFNGMGESEAGMGVSLGVLGHQQQAPDFALHLTHLGGETDTLYAPRSRVGYRDGTHALGLAESSLSRTGFGSLMADLDQDGALDLVVANGAVAAGELDPRATGLLPAYAEADQLLLWEGDRFVDAVDRAGDLGTRLGVSRGVVAGDLDDDGDLDLVVSECGGTIRVYRNDLPGDDSNAVSFRVLDGGTRAVGAVLRIMDDMGADAPRQSFRRVDPCHGYLTSSAGPVHVGLGAATAYFSVEVLWPDGAREAFPGGSAGGVVELVRGQGDDLGREPR